MRTVFSKLRYSASAIVLGCLIAASAAIAQSTPPKMKMTTDIPAEITTPRLRRVADWKAHVLRRCPRR